MVAAPAPPQPPVPVVTNRVIDGQVYLTNPINVANSHTGDLSVGAGGGFYQSLPVGTDGYLLTADSSQATGLNWRPFSTGWRFDVTLYGAKGDGKVAVDGAMTNGQAVLTSASGQFTAKDVGKPIEVSHAGATGVTTLVTTIQSFQSATQVTLAATASATVTASLVMWATDDTIAIQKAINAAGTGIALTGGATVYLPISTGLFYGVAGPLVTTASGNGQLTLPIYPTTGNKGVLRFLGEGNGGAVRHWRQLTPVLQGSTIVSFGAFASTAAQITSLNASGQAAVISGPTGANGYGTSTPGDNGTGPLYNNLMPIFEKLNIITTHTVNGIGYSALNLHGCANAALYDFGYGTSGIVGLGGGTNDFNTPVTFANGLVVGVVMPASSNNDSSPMRNVVCLGGYTRAIYLTEHCDWQGGTVLYSWSGICPVGTYGDGGTGTGAFHGANWSMVSVEGCTYNGEIIGPGASGIGPQIHGIVDNEGTPKWHDNTSGTGLAAARGDVKIVGGGGTVSTDNGTSVRFIDETVACGPATAIPLTINVAAQNTYWRWANVTLQGGTVTSVQVSNLMGGASAPAVTSVFTQSSAALPLYTVRVPPGGWIQVNGTVIPTVNTWNLD